MSAMSPYLSDCMPEERVAIQPPRVDHTNESGWWPMVQPRALSWSSMSGPNTPASMWARPDTSSISSTLFRRPRLSDTTWRVSPGSASRAATMFEPPPKGISTASAATTASTTCSTSRRLPGYRTTSGTRPSRPARTLSRSRTPLPKACTTRVSSSVCTKPSPRIPTSSARSASLSCVAGTSRVENGRTGGTGAVISTPTIFFTNGGNFGLSS